MNSHDDLVSDALETLRADVYPATRSGRRVETLVQQRTTRRGRTSRRSRSWFLRRFLGAGVLVGGVAVAGHQFDWFDGWTLVGRVGDRAVEVPRELVQAVRVGDTVTLTIDELPEGVGPDEVLVVSASPPEAAPRLRIDPFLIASLNFVWELIAAPDNPIWPGWDASDTPALLYLPGVQDVLLNHPNPPAGFVPYEGHPFVGGDVTVRDGPTLIEWDGQNTSRDVWGVRTLVVADTLSNRKNAFRGLLNDPRPTEQVLAGVDYESHLMADPYWRIATIVHEAFHVHQDVRAPGRGANEQTVRLYPCLSVENNVGFVLEAEALTGVLRARSREEAREAGLRWLAARLERRDRLSREAIAYEDGNEFAEGLAMYTEWVLPSVLPDYEPPAELHWAQGFHGFGDLRFLRDEKLEMMRANLRGEVNVNNDPYGTSPVRGRLYFSGMGIAVLLDHVSSDWKRRIFEEDVSLTTLAHEALAPTEEELERALADVRASVDLDAVVETKLALATAGRADTERLLASIDAGPATPIELDYSALESDVSSISFTAFGVRAVDADRCIYTLVPIQASFGGSDHSFAQSIPAATLDDRAADRFRFALSGTVSAARLEDLLGSAPTEASDDRSTWRGVTVDLDLDGVRIRAARADVIHDGRTITVRHLPSR